MDIRKEYPILEFDATREAMIEPQKVIRTRDIPERAVACFFQDVIKTLVEQHQAKLVRELQSEMGTHPIYEISYQGERLAVFHPGVGAPLAAGIFEETIARGVRTCIACGGAGVLDNGINVGEVLVPYAAVRDEGTSYHYLPPSREVAADKAVLAVIEQTLSKNNVPHELIKTWTTDAYYRETPAKVQLRKDEGCKTVEMETATFFAVAQFRGVQFGQLLYGGDDLGSNEWADREWRAHTIRERLFWLAAEACVQVAK